VNPLDAIKLSVIAVTDFGCRNSVMKQVSREILLGFWKAHILHHADEEPLYGQWMLTELRHHGYEISPGTLYPLLQRMERLGWLKSAAASRRGKRARINYRLTADGKKVLKLVRGQIRELYDEVVLGKPEKHSHRRGYT